MRCANAWGAWVLAVSVALLAASGSAQVNDDGDDHAKLMKARQEIGKAATRIKGALRTCPKCKGKGMVVVVIGGGRGVPSGTALGMRRSPFGSLRLKCPLCEGSRKAATYQTFHRLLKAYIELCDATEEYSDVLQDKKGLRKRANDVRDMALGAIKKHELAIRSAHENKHGIPPPPGWGEDKYAKPKYPCDPILAEPEKHTGEPIAGAVTIDGAGVDTNWGSAIRYKHKRTGAGILVLDNPDLSVKQYLIGVVVGQFEGVAVVVPCPGSE